jgi:hypothetical protein
MDKRFIETTDVGTDEQLMVSFDANARLFVDDEPVYSISTLGGGIVALRTALRTVHIGAADYWRVLHGDTPPSLRKAGYMAAQLAHVQSHARALLKQLEQEELLDNSFYPSLATIAAALEIALSEFMAGEPVGV